MERNHQNKLFLKSIGCPKNYFLGLNHHFQHIKCSCDYQCHRLVPSFGHNQRHICPSNYMERNHLNNSFLKTPGCTKNDFFVLNLHFQHITCSIIIRQRPTWEITNETYDRATICKETINITHFKNYRVFKKKCQLIFSILSANVTINVIRLCPLLVISKDICTLF